MRCSIRRADRAMSSIERRAVGASGATSASTAAAFRIVPVVLRNTGELMRPGSLVLNPGVVDVCVLEPETDWSTDDMNDRIAALHRKFEETLARWPSA